MSDETECSEPGCAKPKRALGLCGMHYTRERRKEAKLDPADRSPAWMPRGLCSDPTVDPESFFPGKGESRTYREAKAMCHSCPVENECLTYAIEAGPALFGVWGGTSENERRAMRRRSA